MRHFLLAVLVSANAASHGEVLPSIRGCHPWFYHESEQPHARYHTSVRTLQSFFILFPLFPCENLFGCDTLVSQR